MDDAVVYTHEQNKLLAACIKAGKIRRYNLTDYVSMDNYIDNKTEYERAFEYRENSLKSKANRKISVIYIEGDAGSGKTTLAKKLCEDKELSYCLSGSSRDPVQDYAMKAILNNIEYDTDTAERLADVTHTLDLFADGARQYVQSVYKNCDGRYFLRLQTSDDDYVVPLTGAEADAYLYKYGRKRI